MRFIKNMNSLWSHAARKSRGRLPFPGSEHIVTAYDFLKEINSGELSGLKDKKVVVIGAGNVGMDVASEAYNLRRRVSDSCRYPEACGLRKRDGNGNGKGDTDPLAEVYGKI